MKNISLQAIPNQSLSIRLDNNIYDIVIKEANGIMGVSITRDNILLNANIRAVSGSPIIPYKYQYIKYGNFVFLTNNEEYPYYTQFGITQSLIYINAQELEAIIAGA